MKNTLLNAYNLLLRASGDYGLERDVASQRAASECHSAAMRLRRVLNGEVVFNNESMPLADWCEWRAMELVQFEEVAPQVAQTPEAWDEQFELWLVSNVEAR